LRGLSFSLVFSDENIKEKLKMAHLKGFVY